MAALRWRRDGAGWQLWAGRRRFGRVDPDSRYPNLWRSPLSGGRRSDIANLTWAKHAVMEAARREVEYIAPPKCPVKRGVFEPTSSHSDLNAEAVPNSPNAPAEAA